MKSGSVKDVRSGNRIAAIKRYFQNADILARPLQLIRRLLVLASGVFGLFCAVMTLVFAVVSPLNILSRVMLVLLGVMSVFLLCYAIFMAIFRATLPISALVKTFGVPAILLGLLLVLAATIFDRSHTQNLRIVDNENFSITLGVLPAVFTLLAVVLSFKLHNGYYRASAGTQWEHGNEHQANSVIAMEHGNGRQIDNANALKSRNGVSVGSVSIGGVAALDRKNGDASESNSPELPDKADSPQLAQIANSPNARVSVESGQSHILSKLNAKRDWLATLQSAAKVRGYRVLLGDQFIDCLPEGVDSSAGSADSVGSTSPTGPTNPSVESATATKRRDSYRLLYEGGRYRIARLRPESDNSTGELANFLNPTSAVFYMVLLMEDPRASRPAAISNLAETYRGEEWKVPERVADVISSEYFSCGKILPGRVCVGKSDGLWYVVYCDSISNIKSGYYPTQPCKTYPQALQRMADMAWSLQRSVSLARELDMSYSYDAEQSTAMFISGQSRRSAYDGLPTLYVPTFRLGKKVAAIGGDNGALAHGDWSDIFYTDENSEGLCGQNAGGTKYRPSRMVVFEFALLCFGTALFLVGFALIFAIDVRDERAGAIAAVCLAIQALLFVVSGISLIALVQRLSEGGYRFLRISATTLMVVSLLFLVLLLVQHNQFALCAVFGLAMAPMAIGSVSSMVKKSDKQAKS
ncbi:hypothetical protein OZX72_01545 [Bifidobacterium sp. ESL0769]|uniref:hypothetical protein n=1 Tax=Bifidobacterium sp. ESL0769 TaxID=2983229 RepID=UPI0023F7331B|nr:hypothetical protein [Bifidobacterium sp. ESL0769]WEV67712.1 hypothetical protein OZX72_01545 [Bifidobacterium sp. ESL0769]